MNNSILIKGIILDERCVDILILENKIEKIAENIEYNAKRVIEGRGKYALPGFINMHTHAAMTLMSQKLNPVATIPIQDSIEQTVHIDKVEFPNVTSRTEIEEAFISLTNDAAQWARRKT